MRFNGGGTHSSSCFPLPTQYSNLTKKPFVRAINGREEILHKEFEPGKTIKHHLLDHGGVKSAR
jgi:hypothetical protein